MAILRKKTLAQPGLFDSLNETSQKVDDNPGAEEMEAGPKVLSVGSLTRQLKQLVEPGFSHVWVRGEVSGFRGVNARGHLYFSLKDAEASIDVKMWATRASKLPFALKDGMALIAEGSVDIYAPQGRYSLVAQKLEPEGVGALALAFEQLKAKLLAEGIIGPQRKRIPRRLPLVPKRIGVVTSVTGAALRDFLKVVQRRFPAASVLVADARVQGEGAAREVARAISWMDAQDVDVVVVTRGGGSAEDLWAFNEEVLVRAVAACQRPIVSAVGHEIDTTLCDLAADVRAPTPSAAAEMVVPVLDDLLLGLQKDRQRLVKAMERSLLRARHTLLQEKSRLPDLRRLLSDARLQLSDIDERLAEALRLGVSFRRQSLAQLRGRLQNQRPSKQIQARRAHFEVLRRRLLQAGPKTVEGARRSFLPQVARLEALSPLAVLQRGYSVVTDEAGHVLVSGQEASKGSTLWVRLAELPRLKVRVEDKS